MIRHILHMWEKNIVPFNVGLYYYWTSIPVSKLHVHTLPLISTSMLPLIDGSKDCCGAQHVCSGGWDWMAIIV